MSQFELFVTLLVMRWLFGFNKKKAGSNLEFDKIKDDFPWIVGLGFAWYLFVTFLSFIFLWFVSGWILPYVNAVLGRLLTNG